jgi:hypothetical protein
MHKQDQEPERELDFMVLQMRQEEQTMSGLISEWHCN